MLYYSHEILRLCSCKKKKKITVDREAQHLNIIMCLCVSGCKASGWNGCFVETSHSYHSSSILHWEIFHVKRSFPRKLFFLCEEAGVWGCFILLAKLWFHQFSAHSVVASTLKKKILIVLHWADSYIHAQRCHQCVLWKATSTQKKTTLGRSCAGLKAWEEVKKKLMLVGHVYFMIFIAQSYHTTKKKKEKEKGNNSKTLSLQLF